MPDSFAARSMRFSRFSWGLLAYVLVVILWGVYLRASGSGDGCGISWPDCGGLFPRKGAETKTFIEYAHRASTMLLGFLLLAQMVWGWRLFPRRHPVRFALGGALFFTLLESWIGRHLVVNELVAFSQAPERVYWFAGHQVNTLLLAACFGLVAWWGSGQPKPEFRRQGPFLGMAVFAVLAFLGLTVTGAISALGDTLYPPESHLQVTEMALLPTANFIMKARPLHPYTAVVVAMFLSLVAGLFDHLRPSPQTRRFAYGVWLMLGVQMMLGLINVGLKAPIAMQIIHTAAADVLWISLILMCAAGLAVGVPQVEVLHVPKAVLNGAGAGIKDYVALTKPRVISLLLFTTLAAMFIAAKGWPGNSFLHGLWMLIATGSGLYAAAGASNAINMVCERDLDVRMERTASRPTVTEKIHPRSALWFAFGLEAFSFGILWLSSNLLAATLALAGLVVYVIVYTLLLKRRSWSNIVIGGAAGAFPPLVGYAAAAGELNLLAWTLFALIFVWTPVHFWALAILIKDDYAKAGVPMLPVVKGDRHTVAQIAVYAVITVACSLAPVFMGVGWGYILAALLLNGVLLRGCAKLYRQIDRPHASSLFHYSMLYLALLFLAMAVDLSGCWLQCLVVLALCGLFYLWKFPRKSGTVAPVS